MTGSKHMGLNRKATTVLLSASVVLSVFGSMLYCVFEGNEVRAHVLEDAEQLAQSLAGGIAYGLFRGDMDEIERFTSNAINNERIQAIVIRDEQGEIVHSFTTEAYLHELSLNGGVDEQSDVDISIATIVYSGRSLGTLKLAYLGSEAERFSGRYWRKLALFLAVSFIICALFLFFIQWHCIRPITQLAAFTQRISMMRRYDERLPKMRRSDEIGTLYTSINQLFDTIDDGNQRMENYAGELESLVTLRTEQLSKRANFDELTGLANRYQLMDCLQEFLDSAGTNEYQLALILIDLDKFKHINDTHGHHMGDFVLKGVSRRISEALLPDEFFARLGGDEFVVIIPDLEGEEHAIKVARRIQAAINTEVFLDSLKLTVSASMGISLFPDHGRSPTEMLKYADISMYSRKSEGRSGFTTYSSVKASHTRRTQIELALPDALKRNEFELLYQPQYELSTGLLSGFEALLYWKNAELGDPKTQEFIPLASETAYIHEITHWILGQATKDISLIHQSGLTSTTMSVSISPVTLKSERLREQLFLAMADLNLPPGTVELEIKEDNALTKLVDLYGQMIALKEMSIRLAIDDFGAQHTSLMQIVGLPLDTLILDSAMVSSIQVSNNYRDLIVSIVSLAKGLGLRIVAKGVESKAQYDFLKEVGCDRVQGQYLQSPTGCSELITLLAEQASTSSVLLSDEKKL